MVGWWVLTESVHVCLSSAPGAQAVARLLIILWEHELPVLKHAHGVADEGELCDVLLHYAKETLKVRRRHCL